ncbi:MAG: adenylyltransferase/cytidyltransferase family protein [Planctomycetes bacterium]|nr:adenylyltransferase/cytidyltransferase family protein [Planctomycetota bacterium]MCB9917221.1 adenylyltransferase/cytidyltransferase family protein [Planctomycetota bacterium]
MALTVSRKKAKDKIVKSLRNLSAIVDGLKSQGKSIVLTTGCFDLLHVGHVRFLEDAKSRGDFLVVAVFDDKATAAQKGKGYPVQETLERMELLAGLESVDYVCALGDDDGTKLVESLVPSVYAKGTNHNERGLSERVVMKANGVKFLACGDKKAHSASKIVAKIRKRKFD